MLKEKESAARKAIILSDASIVTLALFLSYFLRQHFYKFYKLDIISSTQVIADTIGSISDYLVMFIFVVLLWCFMLYINGMYRSMRTRTLLEIVWIILKSSFFANLALGAVIFLFNYNSSAGYSLSFL